MQLYCVTAKLMWGCKCWYAAGETGHTIPLGMEFCLASWQQKQQGDAVLIECPSFSCDEFTADREANSFRRTTTKNHAMVRAGPHGPGETAGPWALLASPGIWRDETISGLLYWTGRGGEEYKLWWISSTDKEKEALIWERDGCR